MNATLRRNSVLHPTPHRPTIKRLSGKLSGSHGQESVAADSSVCDQRLEAIWHSPDFCHQRSQCSQQILHRTILNCWQPSAESPWTKHHKTNQRHQLSQPGKPIAAQLIRDCNNNARNWKSPSSKHANEVRPLFNAMHHSFQEWRDRENHHPSNNRHRHKHQIEPRQSFYEE